jgi:hypothetical protein
MVALNSDEQAFRRRSVPSSRGKFDPDVRCIAGSERSASEVAITQRHLDITSQTGNLGL